jgi:hypothetical protein
MYAQTLQTVAPSEVRRLVCRRDPLSSSPELHARVLNVVSLPSVRVAADPAATPRDRQGGMDFLHRLVMG